MPQPFLTLDIGHLSHGHPLRYCEYKVSHECPSSDREPLCAVSVTQKMLRGCIMNRFVNLENQICCFSGEAHIEFCCHLARGNIDPKEPPVYEYVKFVGDFKFHSNGEDFYFPLEIR